MPLFHDEIVVHTNDLQCQVQYFLHEDQSLTIGKFKHTITIFEYMFPNAIAESTFNQPSAHGAFAKDALNAKEMNVQPGGKQHAMHGTYIPWDNLNPELWGKLQQWFLQRTSYKDTQIMNFMAKKRGCNVS
ncbi:hypothetical protein EDD17DRAFT_1507757 [Pisolithus thermaeus]|nr:hypothetical protein EV401DRAFT_1883119 [Pisolithus croceorrhizus]KAI6162906.1 hypothetical protein EDD17DRAFT_1507757 [Pisolithus thermaeus]